MKTLYIITGTSEGIGKALAERALEQGHEVVGISRRETIDHERYTHHSLDLANPAGAGAFEWPAFDPWERVVFVNNAGWIGPVRPLGELKAEEITRAIDINLSSAFVMLNDFIARAAKYKGMSIAANTSSGAATYAMPSWSAYCTTKAALHMLYEVGRAENSDLHFYSLSPGVVDTGMQRDIRETDPEKFPAYDRFYDLYEKGELQSPESIARKMTHVFDNPGSFGEVFVSLKDFSL